MLEEIKREAGGRLTIFLGAAPGVGKTYAMLSRARDLEKQGIDVVVGVVETHGRAETQALLKGLEVLPRTHIEYRGLALDELDLDGLLARRPHVALVDELAHRNVPGSRHERRWQDVVELLDAGIDVYTTINIQHLESLNDVVHRITGVRVSETVPDLVFDRLRDIKLIDLPPRELIERLQQGKVYIPEQAANALQAFFSPSNLAALRELAMQTAADRVENDWREAQLARGLPGVPLRRRVLVAIDGRGQSEYLVRMARRLAERRNAPWGAITVLGGVPTHGDQQREIDRAFALARRLGGDTEVLHGANIVDAIIDHAGYSGASTIVLGRTRERPLARMFNRTITQQLLQRGAHLELTIVSTPEARAQSRRALRDMGGQLSGHDPALAIGATAIGTGVAWLAERFVGLQDLSIVYIVVVVLVASMTRMAAAVLAAVLCFLAYNYFFIEPLFTLYIGARQGVATAILFLVAALVAGRLAARLRAQVVALRSANAHTTSLQALARNLSSAADLGLVIEAGQAALQHGIDGDALVHTGEGLIPDGPYALGDKDRAAADWTRRHGKPAGRFTDTLANADWWFLPLMVEDKAEGVVGLRLPSVVKRLGTEQRRLAEAMAGDIAEAVVRTRLVAALEDARVSSETERLRSALLASVSHDLRSPLASIIGAAGSLESYGQRMTADDRHELLKTIRMEGERLDRYIQNLLDMTRLGHGSLTLNRDWISVDKLIDSAVSRLQRYQAGAMLEVHIGQDLGPIWVHPALVEQAIFNVIENAEKFSPEGETVTIEARRSARGGVQIDVRDRGPGIPEDERKRIFDMFFSVERGDRRREGIGLGLAIAQSIVGAHGGSIEALPDGAADSARRGTIIRITLPPVEPEP